MKRLIVTADDVGLDRGMNEGALRAHREGIVTACSVVANGAAFDDAVARLRDAPGLEAGVHLTLVEETALTIGRPMPRNYLAFLARPARGIESELRAQIEKVLAAGLRVTHLNGHQHLHVLPSVRPVVRKLAVEFGIPYVRRVADRGGRAGVARRVSLAALHAIGRRAGGTNDCTIGVAEAGHLTAGRILELLDEVEGLTELVTHPGVAVSGYRQWRYQWDEETRALCDPRLREAIAARGIELVAPSRAG
ncbi:MAG TPA: ChbG/HpnK family deacetylase [Thermoanaerobaculia bacterium]|nr:ChbG/HpnK family deacetylase [Thermoanaerobaculia bacterium]